MVGSRAEVMIIMMVMLMVRGRNGAESRLTVVVWYCIWMTFFLSEKKKKKGHLTKKKKKKKKARFET